MKTLATLAIILLLSFTLFSCSPEDDGIFFNGNSEVVNISTVSYSAIEIEILNLINNHRTSLGLSKLNTLTIISGVADGHTDYMIEVGTINHDNFSKRSQTLMDQADAITVGENVAYGYSTAQGVVNGWLNSASHRKIIENPNYTHFGISTEVNTKNRNYFTQIFIKK
ncbi:MAG: hypothetical protein COC16_04695 [Lutibacter sp.]|nr:MAG: hypothetical protein COC16_04695 [Lutibacter sp.]